jgi:solute:Na+ symporter, SSS family
VEFYRKVRPVGPGWKPIRDLVGVDANAHAARDSIPLGLLGWTAGSAMIWSALFAVGNALYGRTLQAVVLTAACLACTAVVLWVMRQQWPDNA